MVVLAPQAADGAAQVRVADRPLDRVGEVNALVDRIHDADVHDLGVEDLPTLVTDEVVHRLHVKVRGESLLDAVDHGKFRRALVSLLEQALRLVKETRIFERHAETRGNGQEQTFIAGCKGVLVVKIFQDNQASDIVSTDKRAAEE